MYSLYAFIHVEMQIITCAVFRQHLRIFARVFLNSLGYGNLNVINMFIVIKISEIVVGSGNPAWQSNRVGQRVLCLPTLGQCEICFDHRVLS